MSKQMGVRKRYAVECSNPDCRLIFYASKSIGMMIGMNDCGCGPCPRCKVFLNLTYIPEQDIISARPWYEHLAKIKAPQWSIDEAEQSYADKRMTWILRQGQIERLATVIGQIRDGGCKMLKDYKDLKKMTQSIGIRLVGKLAEKESQAKQIPYTDALWNQASIRMNQLDIQEQRELKEILGGQVNWSLQTLARKMLWLKEHNERSIQLLKIKEKNDKEYGPLSNLQKYALQEMITTNGYIKRSFRESGIFKAPKGVEVSITNRSDYEYELTEEDYLDVMDEYRTGGKLND